MLEQDVPGVLAEVSGKPVKTGPMGTMSPAFFGGTKLSLMGDRVIEVTRRLTGRRHCEIPLVSVDSAEIEARGNPAWALLGILTLPVLVGILFLVLYFKFSHRFLIIRSGLNAQLLAIRDDDEAPYHQFLQAVLRASTQAKRG